MPQLPLDFPPGLGYSEQYARKERTRHDLPRIQSQIRPHPRSPAGGGHPPGRGAHPAAGGAGQRQDHHPGDPAGLSHPLPGGGAGAHPHRHLHRGRRRGHEAALCRPLWGGARRRAGLPHHQRHLPVHHLLLRLGQGGGALRPVDERGGAERPGALADAVPRGRVAGGAGGEGGAHPHHLLQERDAAGRGGAGH